MTEIVGINGKRLARKKTKEATIAISGSDDGVDWFYIKPEDVPEWIKIDEVMTSITNGEVVSQGEGGPYYFGEVVH
jgi:hypothetical protein